MHLCTPFLVQKNKKMKRILIKNAQIINFSSTTNSDLLIKNNKIEKIGENLNENADIEIDASGKYILPGGVDPHVHFNLPTFVGNTADDFVTGSKAALFGGTTSVIDFVSPAKNESLISALQKRIEETKASLCNVNLHLSPTWWGENSAYEIERAIKEFGIKSFKVYLAYKNGVGINDDVLLKVMDIVGKNNCLVTVHAENDELIEYNRRKLIQSRKTQPKYHPISRPDDVEADAISRVITYSKYTKCDVYIVHVSSKKGIDLIENAQKNGIKIYAETCPHYLLLTDSVYNSDFETSAKYVLSPPLRKKEDNDALWNAIEKGVIQTIGTDHCSFNIKGQKDFGKNDFTKIVNGAGGVEHRFELLYTYGVMQNKISLNKLVEICCYNPAKIFGLKNKGEIKVGNDADVIIWNPNFEKTILVSNQMQNCDNNIFENFKTMGKAETIILGGKIIKF